MNPGAPRRDGEGSGELGVKRTGGGSSKEGRGEQERAGGGGRNTGEGEEKTGESEDNGNDGGSGGMTLCLCGPDLALRWADAIRGGCARDCAGREGNAHRTAGVPCRLCLRKHLVKRTARRSSSARHFVHKQRSAEAAPAGDDVVRLFASVDCGEDEMKVKWG